MAYMNQEKKKALAPLIKSICKKHGIKATLGVDNYSTLMLNVKSNKIDSLKNKLVLLTINSYFCLAARLLIKKLLNKLIKEQSLLKAGFKISFYSFKRLIFKLS